MRHSSRTRWWAFHPVTEHGGLSKPAQAKNLEDEAVVKIASVKHWLWRAVDEEDLVLDILVQSRCDTQAAERLLRKLFKRQSQAPRVMITYKLASYSAAKSKVMPFVEHGKHKGLNNSAKNSHQLTRRRERQIKRFKSAGQAQRFLSAHDGINNLFHLRRGGSVSSRANGGPDGEPGRLQVGSDPLRGDREPGMECVCCGSAAVTERRDRTAHGYRRFCCRDCGRQFNERSARMLNRTQYPSDVIALVVLCRLRYRLTLRDLAEMFLHRSIVFSHDRAAKQIDGRDWEAKLAPVLAHELRQRRHGKAGAGGRSWFVDETYLRVRGRWCYLYRAVDRHGALIDIMLSEHRDIAAATAFSRSAKSVADTIPDRVTTDGHGSYPRAIRPTLGRRVEHRTSDYLNNCLEQDHRGIKGRIRCMRGFKSFGSAARFCRGYDELRNFCRLRTRLNQPVPACHRRLLQRRRPASVLAILQAA